MKKTLLSAVLMLFLITSFKSYSQDTIKYDYNESGHRTERVIALGGGKGDNKPDPAKDLIKIDTLADKIGERSISIYPNPTQNEITVEISSLEETDNASIFIYDQLGRLRLTQTEISSRNTISLAKLPKGIYFMIIRMKRGNTKWTIIKG